MRELVFEFSGPILMNSYVQSLIMRIVSLLGGTDVYIEDGNKIVVVGPW